MNIEEKSKEMVHKIMQSADEKAVYEIKGKKYFVFSNDSFMKILETTMKLSAEQVVEEIQKK